MGMTLQRLIFRELAECEPGEEEQWWSEFLGLVHSMHRDFMDHNTVCIPVEDRCRSRSMVFGLQQRFQRLEVDKE